MKGTEKQIAWATDIINAPANAIKMYADGLANTRITSCCAESESLVKAIETYKTMIESVPQMQDASFVISNRSKFGSIALEAVRRTLLADGIQPSAAMANLRANGL